MECSDSCGREEGDEGVDELVDAAVSTGEDMTEAGALDGRCSAVEVEVEADVEVDASG